MRFGIHVSTSGGFKQAALRAVAAGCETMQVFSSNPMGWKVPPLDANQADDFMAIVGEKEIRPVFLHTPYLVNLASPDGDLIGKSRDCVATAVLRAEILGAAYVVTHIGSHKGAGLEAGLARVSESLDFVLQTTEDDVMILLENTTGSGNSIGRSFEDFYQILNSLPQHGDRLGVCLDTAHLWGAGFDISTGEGVDQTVEAFAARVGRERLHLIHANDSSVKLNSHRDIHQPPGKGLIGIEAFNALVNHPRLADLPFILELPTEDTEAVVEVLRAMRLLVRVEG
ncbi:MAG: deoxyribonuclease IV [Dehalococcoidia bacterium]|nr:deoxyribonuclease IV [Dehalococcoidia bacterium]